ncbi:uncharacterized protein [Nicotiana sylvestris]|uniref:uncharacterized protein n=1 Tax=Nicotiana sylvestris TaxID=4096 RepID=UPI00388C776D
MVKKNANSDAQLASHNTSIRNLEVQLGQISQSLNTRPKGALPSDTVVNQRVGTMQGINFDEVELQEDDISLVVENVTDENLNEEVRIDIQDNEVETQNDMNPSREHIIDMPKIVMPKAKVPFPRPPPPYRQRLAKQKNENKFKKFIDMMKSLSINVPLVEALEQMLGYVKFMKDLVTKKKSMDCDTSKMTHQVSTIVNYMAQKLEDLGAFTIQCTIGSANFAKALCDLGVSINLMPYSIFKTLGIGKPRATSMRLQMADRTMKSPLGIVDDVLVRVDKFILPADFVILDCEALVDVEVGEHLLGGDEKVVFHVCKSMKHPNSTKVCSFVDIVMAVIVDDTSAIINMEDPLEVVLLNLDVNEDEGRVECVNALHGMGSYSYNPRKLSLDLENRKALPIKPSIEEPPMLELKLLPPHLRMPFGLCNAPATFQQCMMAIFTDMVDDILEVFMDDFSVEGIVLGHNISKHDIKVDKAKIEVISKLPPSTSVKGVRSFLGHAGFYRRFIKDFSKVVNPLCKLLEKYDKFMFNEE